VRGKQRSNEIIEVNLVTLPAVVSGGFYKEIDWNLGRGVAGILLGKNH
jgi:hypothetical protein